AADPRQNAVIVRDYAANMAGYRKLITELDQRQQMIEISVKIISEMNTALQASITENVNLIRSIPQQHLTQVETLVMQSVSRGRDL
ncbi:hypothetical protein MJI20_27730, partial [Salmonella enterica subsp. enterica serovar Anatum]|nr:hypothetical protein [Salmonella enterica subsp. enterica serovar Anatum]